MKRIRNTARCFERFGFRRISDFDAEPFAAAECSFDERSVRYPARYQDVPEIAGRKPGGDPVILGGPAGIRRRA